MIGENAFYYCDKLKKVLISEDSKLETIKKDAFKMTSIEKFFISPKLLNISGIGFSNLIDMSISPHNSSFSLYNDTSVIGKSKNELDNFDSLYIALHDVEKAVIPSFITKICSNAFF